MAEVHPTAIVHPTVVLGESVRVGAYSIIDEGAQIGNFCDIQDHVVIRRLTKIGNDVKIFPFAVIGAEPQHFKYQGEETLVEIGDGAIIRESVTIHRGTSFGRSITTVGEGTLLMAYVHVAHDCIVGKKVIMANGVQLAGHTTIEDFAVVGGLSGISQFCRVGKYCYLGSASMIRKDLPPFLTGKGNDFKVQGINVIGLQRNNFSSEAINKLRKVYKIFYRRHLTVAKAIEQVQEELGETNEVRVFLDFIRQSEVGVIR